MLQIGASVVLLLVGVMTFYPEVSAASSIISL